MPNTLDLDKWTVNKPNFYFFDRQAYSMAGCGACTLALLTGANPFKISQNKLGKKGHFSNTFMRKFLTRKGFKLIKITDNKVLNRDTATLEEHIQDNHVLLYCIKITQKMYSWVVIYGNPSLMFHNFEIIKMKGLDFENFPVDRDSRYILWKKSWT